METPTLRALIVEDDRLCAQLLKEMLMGADGQEERVEIEFAESLCEGLMKAGGSSFDVAVVDLHLPDGDGAGVCEALHAKAPALAIVVVSGSSEKDGFASECMQKGAQDYLVKGCFDSRHLLHSLRYAVQRKRIETKYKNSQIALEEANRSLTEKVRDLDRLNAVMMGREEKILEMKEEIRLLKEQISTAWRLAS